MQPSSRHAQPSHRPLSSVLRRVGKRVHRRSSDNDPIPNARPLSESLIAVEQIPHVALPQPLKPTENSGNEAGGVTPHPAVGSPSSFGIDERSPVVPAGPMALAALAAGFIDPRAMGGNELYAPAVLLAKHGKAILPCDDYSLTNECANAPRCYSSVHRVYEARRIAAAAQCQRRYIPRLETEQDQI